MDKTASPWSVPVAVEDIPETGLHLEIEAPAEARAQLAALADVRDLPRLSAVFDLTRLGAGVHVTGAGQGQGRPDLRGELGADRNRSGGGGGPAFHRRASGDADEPDRRCAKSRAKARSRRNRWSTARSIWARSRPNS